MIILETAKRGHVTAKKQQGGAVLLEAMIAILIFSMGILALVGLQAAMVKNTSDAKYRAEASFLAQQILGQMWVANQGNLADFAGEEDISFYLPNGKRIVETRSEEVGGKSVAEVDVIVTWQLPGEAERNYSTSARIGM